MHDAARSRPRAQKQATPLTRLRPSGSTAVMATMLSVTLGAPPMERAPAASGVRSARRREESISRHAEGLRTECFLRVSLACSNRRFEVSIERIARAGRPAQRA